MSGFAYGAVTSTTGSPPSSWVVLGLLKCALDPGLFHGCPHLRQILRGTNAAGPPEVLGRLRVGSGQPQSSRSESRAARGPFTETRQVAKEGWVQWGVAPVLRQSVFPTH